MTETTSPLLARRSLLSLAALPWLAPTAWAQAAAWPQKPIRIVVPYAAGGSADTLGRILTQPMGESLGQPFVIENRAGAGGAIGSQVVAKSPPDGYTLVVSGIGSHVIAPASGPTPFDPMKDFTHIALLGGPPTVLVVNSDIPVKDLKGFIDFFNKDPKGLSWGSPGDGTHGHLVGELFTQATKMRAVHLGYKGAAPAMQDLVAKQIPAAFVTFASANAQMRTGRVRALGITSSRRNADYPDVPTFAELGFPSLTATTWFALSGPPGMPAAVVDQINREVRKALKTPAALEKLAFEGMETPDWDATAVQNYFRAEIDRWTGVIRGMKKS